MLPRYILEPMISSIAKLTLKSARQMEEQFNASLTATLLKIVETDRYPIVLVCHTQMAGAGSGDPKVYWNVGFLGPNLTMRVPAFLCLRKAQEEANSAAR